MSNFLKVPLCLAFSAVCSLATTYIAVVETIASDEVLFCEEKNFIIDRLRTAGIITAIVAAIGLGVSFAF